MSKKRRPEAGIQPAALGPVDCHGLSEKGPGRDVNQDDFLSAHLRVPSASGWRDIRLLAVADGLGGAPGGDEASAMAVIGLHRILNALSSGLDPAADLRDPLRDAVIEVDSEIRAYAAVHPGMEGMATTLTAVLVSGTNWFAVHVGDSRCYHLGGGRLDRITQDHTMANRLMELGVPVGGIVRPTRWEHLLWNVVGGTGSPVRPETAAGELRAGDALLLCTDGLTKSLPEKDIHRILDAREPARRTCLRLLWAAEEAGREDDATVVLARVGSDRKS